jgi:hypothetical protein
MNLRPGQCMQTSTYYDIDDRYPAVDIPIGSQVLKLAVSKVRRCYRSDIDHRDQIVTIKISVFRLYCMVVLHACFTALS